MDLLAIIRSGIDALPDGDYIHGLKAVVNHIEVAIRHLQVGQESGEIQLYTDAVYRCNQAFEGSLKELYRVSAARDPTKATPQKIEKFLDEENVLRQKVISQLSRYRQEWRNPSTHDYTMDFDENEAFLAIVNIAAFAKMAVGQIASKIAFDLARESETKASIPQSLSPELDSVEDLAETLAIYSAVYLQDSKDMVSEGPLRRPEAQMTSMLAGFLSKIEEIEILIEHRLSDDSNYFVDILALLNDDKCIVELRSATSMKSSATRAVDQLQKYLEISPDSAGVLVVYGQPGDKYKVFQSPSLHRRLTFFVIPTEAASSLEALSPEIKIEETLSKI